MKKIDVLIITGSDSDLPTISATATVLDEFNVAYDVRVGSAHRTPSHVRAIVKDAEKRGAKVFIAAAGMSAALPGVVAAETIRPVIGVPIEGKTLASMDALFSIAQMPPGIPVGAMAIGKAGATNAGIMAVEILATTNKALAPKLQRFRTTIALTVTQKDKKLQKLGIKRYISEHKK